MILLLLQRRFPPMKQGFSRRSRRFTSNKRGTCNFAGIRRTSVQPRWRPPNFSWTSRVVTVHGQKRPDSVTQRCTSVSESVTSAQRRETSWKFHKVQYILVYN
jgi:hypothetical protein